MSAISAEDDLDVVWPRVIAKAAAIAKWNLDDKSVTLTPDAIIAKINPPKCGDGSTARDEAKKVFSRALVCIETFGNIAAQAAGMVCTITQQQ